MHRKHTSALRDLDWICDKFWPRRNDDIFKIENKIHEAELQEMNRTLIQLFMQSCGSIWIYFETQAVQKLFFGERAIWKKRINEIHKSSVDTAIAGLEHVQYNSIII